MPRDVRGRFLPGPGPDKHTLMAGERAAGGRAAMRRYRNEWGDWIGPAWLYHRLRGWYRRRRSCAGPAPK